MEQLGSLFQLLSDKTRLGILLLLLEGERNVTSLCKELSLPQPTVSHHLALLRGKGLINNRRHGKQVYYSIRNSHLTGSDQKLTFTLDKFTVNISPA